MEMQTVTYTHKGYFGLCPVYFANLESQAPNVEPRHWSIAWLMWLSELIYGAIFFVRSSVDAGYEPEWPLSITEKLEQPITRSYPLESRP